MTNPLISVIIPVYKVEPYLRKCVDSVLAQTYADIPFSTNARVFFKQNAERVNIISEFFCVQESKDTFLGVIKFRQTGKRNSYMFNGKAKLDCKGI